MNRDGVIKAAFFACRAMGQTTSRRNIGAMVAKIAGKGMRPSEIAEWLRSQNGNHLGTIKEPLREPSREPLIKHKNDGLGTTTGTIAGTTREPATLKDVVSNTSSETNVSSQTTLLPSVVTPSKSKKARKEPSESDLAAYAVLTACWKELRDHGPEIAITERDWKAQNKRAALSLVASGKTPEECASRLRFAYTNPEKKAYYGGIVRLEKLAEHWGKIGLPVPAQPQERQGLFDANGRPRFGGDEPDPFVIPVDKPLFPIRRAAQ